MMKIQSLLNPLSPEESDFRESQSPTPSSYGTSRSATPSVVTSRRGRLPKDAAIFSKAKPTGIVRYPPHEAGDDEELAATHRRFQVFPMSGINEYCRHIPYNSEKKSFLAKTGRGAFEGQSGQNDNTSVRGTCILIASSLPVHVQSPRRRA